MSRIFILLTFLLCCCGGIHINPDPTPTPIPVLISCEDLCKHFSDLRCEEAIEGCVDTCNDNYKSLIGYDRMSTCIMNAGTCDESRNCN